MIPQIAFSERRNDRRAQSQNSRGYLSLGIRVNHYLNRTYNAAQNFNIKILEASIRPPFIIKICKCHQPSSPLQVMHRSPVAILLRTRHLLGSPMTIKQHTTPLVLKVSSESSNPYVLKMPITTSTSTSKPAPPATRSKHEWLVILPDHDGILEKRMSVRQYVTSNLSPRDF